MSPKTCDPSRPKMLSMSQWSSKPCSSSASMTPVPTPWAALTGTRFLEAQEAEPQRWIGSFQPPFFPLEGDGHQPNGIRLNKPTDLVRPTISRFCVSKLSLCLILMNLPSHFYPYFCLHITIMAIGCSSEIGGIFSKFNRRTLSVI